MARYVVVEFSDNAEAEAFIQQVNSMNSDDRELRLPFRRRIAAVFVKPGRTCECSSGIRWGMTNFRNPDKMKHQGAGIVRGEKFGWWVCTICKKPRKGGHNLVNQLRLSDTYEGHQFDDFEFEVTGLEVGGIHTSNISRLKKLRRKKPKGDIDATKEL